MWLRDVSSITVAPNCAASRDRRDGRVGKSPSRTMPSTFAASAFRASRRNVAAGLDHRQRHDAALRGRGDEFGGVARAATGS